MLAVFLKTLPFFAIIGLGYVSGRTRFFTDAGTAWLSKFVFYFALSAMLFQFSANLSIGEVFDWNILLAYLCGCILIYALATAVALFRGRPAGEAAVEAQCAVIGNTGYLGVPLLTVLLGPAAIGPIMMILSVDLLVFGSLIVIIVTVSRDGRFGPVILISVAKGLLNNPMIVSIAAGFLWSASGMPIPVPLNEFLSTLGAAATPGALFAIGASLASKHAERMSIAVWLSTCKLLLHPAAVAVMALFVFSVDSYSAGVMISAAALPVAGNVYMLAQHFGIAPHRVSAAILVSTAVSVVTVSAVIAWVTT